MCVRVRYSDGYHGARPDDADERRAPVPPGRLDQSGSNTPGNNRVQQPYPVRGRGGRVVHTPWAHLDRDTVAHLRPFRLSRRVDKALPGEVVKHVHVRRPRLAVHEGMVRIVRCRLHQEQHQARALVAAGRSERGIEHDAFVRSEGRTRRVELDRSRRRVVRPPARREGRRRARPVHVPGVGGEEHADVRVASHRHAPGSRVHGQGDEERFRVCRGSERLVQGAPVQGWEPGRCQVELPDGREPFGRFVELDDGQLAGVGENPEQVRARGSPFIRGGTRDDL